MKCCLVLFVILLTSSRDGNAAEEKDVEYPILTVESLGTVRGSFLLSAGGRQFSAFRGIPYAKPPLGRLRFKDPVPADPWDDVLDASKEGPFCLQSGMGMLRGQEDCLKINVYTHDVRPNQLKPVMVWIHGGAFVTGSGNGESDFFGPGYIMDRDVVMVTLNYRLGVFGFFTTEDSAAPGNYGLLDQTLALKWVRENIEHFGGDPKSVTIFGESAGGASVDYHMLSPRSKGLFDRAIAQSGSALCTWASTDKIAVSKYSKLIAKDLKCDLGSSSKMMKCLRERDAMVFMDILLNYDKPMGIFPLVLFGPRVDKERESPFLPAEPTELIRKKQFKSVPYIMGVTQNEGVMMAAVLVAQDGQGLELFKKDPIRYIPVILDFELHPNRKAIAKKLYDKYFDADKPVEKQLGALEKMASDVAFFKGVDDSVHLYSQYSDHPVYYYNYAHKGQYRVDMVLGSPPDFDYVAGHADDLFVLFTTNIFPLITNPNDIKVSKVLVDLWTSFAIHGVPKSDSVESPGWIPLDSDGSNRYLNIKAEGSGMINESMPFHHRMAFLDHLLEKSVPKDEL